MDQQVWDAAYQTEHYVYGESPNDFLETHYVYLPKGKILCLAEGEGRNAVFLASKGYTVTAVDISTAGLEKTQKLAHKYGVSVETIHADLATFDLGKNRWDGIVSIFCHLPSHIRCALYKRVEHALRPSGIFLLESYTPAQLQYKTGGPPVEDMLISQKTLMEELPRMQFHYLKALDREVIEGTKHTGLAAVVQAIGFMP